MANGWGTNPDMQSQGLKVSLWVHLRPDLVDEMCSIAYL